MANFIRGGSRIYAQALTPAPSIDAPRLRQLGQNDLALTVENTLRAAPAAPAGQPNPPAKGDNYLSALLKLVPAEIITVYLATKDTASEHNALTIWFVLCLITCFIFRAYSNLPDNPGATFKDVQLRTVLVSVVAFFLWAFATAEPGKPPIAGLNFEPWLAGAVAGAAAGPGRPAGERRQSARVARGQSAIVEQKERVTPASAASRQCIPIFGISLDFVRKSPA